MSCFSFHAGAKGQFLSCADVFLLISMCLLYYSSCPSEAQHAHYCRNVQQLSAGRRQAESGEGGSSLPAVWQVWMKLTQAGLPPTPVCRLACAQEGLWAFLVLARGEGAVLRHGSVSCSCDRGCVAGMLTQVSPSLGCCLTPTPADRAFSSIWNSSQAVMLSCPSWHC